MQQPLPLTSVTPPLTARLDKPVYCGGIAIACAADASYTYHAFTAASGSKYNIPDLAIAFNSGFSDIATESWLKTARLLIVKKIPTIFTVWIASYNSRLRTNALFRRTTTKKPKKRRGSSVKRARSYIPP
ncbi:hypothetical protein C8R44DRAFT_882434 [Mycena epipterygia]|nr:hypothetical protein C8R44DRAFT_882434 [Mycena epipterygia]